MLNNSTKIKNTLNATLTLLAFILGIILMISIFLGIPYILENLSNTNKILSAISKFNI